jgi:hypothetical protein
MLDLANVIVHEGAAAFLLGFGDRENVPVMMGLTCCNGKVGQIPAANVGKEDTLLCSACSERDP